VREVMTHYAHSVRDAPPDRWHLLAEHLEDTGAPAAVIAANWGAESWGHAVGRLHAIGKFAVARVDWRARRSSTTARRARSLLCKPTVTRTGCSPGP